jgi:hypothetical protein
VAHHAQVEEVLHAAVADAQPLLTPVKTSDALPGFKAARNL